MDVLKAIHNYINGIEIAYKGGAAIADMLVWGFFIFSLVVEILKKIN